MNEIALILLFIILLFKSLANRISLNLTYSNKINQSKFLHLQSFTNTKLPTISGKSLFIQSSIPISNSINEEIYNKHKKTPNNNVKEMDIKTTISNKDTNSQTVNYLFTKSSKYIIGENEKTFLLNKAVHPYKTQ